MKKKKIAAMIIFVLCIFFIGQNTEAADVSKTTEVTDYRQIAELVSEHWENDFFGKITVESGSDTIEKDGQKEKLSEELDISTAKAKQITKSEQKLEDYLETQEDGIYEVEKTEEGKLEIEAPYQTKRLIVCSAEVTGTYGAKEIYQNKMDGQTILQYDTEEAAKEACEKLRSIYGEKNCYPDLVTSFAQSMETSEEKTGKEDRGDSGITNYSWGDSYMGFDQLKQQAQSQHYRQVTVAVIDTGINASNFMFKGRTISKKSYNFFNANNNVKDVFGHGTHVSGIIVDSTPSNVNLLVLRVGDSKGRASLLSIDAALQYAIQQKVAVINLSMGFEDKKAYEYTYLDKSINKAYERGIPLCVAAGNQTSGGVDVKYCYPACNKKTIAVSALDEDSTLAYYSNRGSGIDFCAPGTGIVSADWKGKTRKLSGTSMAAPHITAAIAYIKMMQPNLSVDGICRELKLYAKDLGSKGKDRYYGWGCPIMTEFLQKGITYKNYVVILRPNLKYTYNSGKGVTLRWNKTVGAQRYSIYRKGQNGKWKKIGAVSAATPSYLDRTAKAGQKYSYRVRAYNNGRYGGYSQTKVLYCLKKPAIQCVTKKKKQVQISWKKQRQASLYQIEYARNKDFKRSKRLRKSSKENRVLTRKLKKGIYYFRLRYIYRRNSIKTWSAWSGVRTLKVN